MSVDKLRRIRELLRGTPRPAGALPSLVGTVMIVASATGFSPQTADAAVTVRAAVSVERHELVTDVRPQGSSPMVPQGGWDQTFNNDTNPFSDNWVDGFHDWNDWHDNFGDWNK